MADYESLPPGVVNLDQPGSCTLQRGGHNPNPIQSRLHFNADDPTIGIVETHGERVLLLTADGPIALVNHDCDRFLGFAEKNAGRECRYRQSMLSFTQGPTPGISVAQPDDLGICQPPWARKTIKAWRIGRPESGAPVGRQRWTFDVTWGGIGRTGIERTKLAKAPFGVEDQTYRSPWAAGLAAKIRDLSRRGPHTIGLKSISGRVNWRIRIDKTAATAERTDSDSAPLGPVPIAEAPTLADVIHDSYAKLETPSREPIRVDIRSRQKPAPG